VPLTEQDIKLFTRYGKGPYNDSLRKVEGEIKGLNQKITELIGIKESDTGLALPSQWNFPADKEMMKE
jgi:26S proteasome regulatory subunit T1